MPKLYVVRHGQPASEWNQDPDPGLSALGQSQAADVAMTLSKLSCQDVVSSPMARAAETAAISAIGHNLRTEQAIREIPSYWVLSSQRKTWLDKVLRSNWKDLEPEIKVWREGLTNWASTIEDNTLAFSHFVVINALVATATNSDKVVNALPDHCAIAEFDVIDGQLHFVGIDRELDSDIMV